MIEEKYKKLYINLLESYELLSTCSRLHVAALLVKHNTVVSAGYNGVPNHEKHCCDIFKIENFKDQKLYYINDENVEECVWNAKHHEFSEHNEVHAEMNCLLTALKNNASIKDCILVVSIAPCINCAKAILAAGIETVYYKELYDRSDDGIKFLQKHNVLIQRL